MPKNIGKDSEIVRKKRSTVFFVTLITCRYNIYFINGILLKGKWGGNVFCISSDTCCNGLYEWYIRFLHECEARVQKYNVSRVKPRVIHWIFTRVRSTSVKIQCFTSGWPLQHVSREMQNHCHLISPLAITLL